MSSSDAPLVLPSPALVVLIGVRDDVRAAFAARHFPPEERCATLDAAGKRLTAGQPAVLNAPHLTPDARADAVLLARAQHVPAVAVVLDPDGHDPDSATRRAVAALRAGLGGPDAPALPLEGFREVRRVRRPDLLPAGGVTRVPLRPDRRDLSGPFDVVGDVHGCLPELLDLLGLLGYAVQGEQVTPPPGRTLVFVGDLTDRGPDSPGVLRLVGGMLAAGTALCVQGNHDAKLLRALSGHAVKVTHGLEVTLTQLDHAPPDARTDACALLAGLPHHLVLDGGRLVVVHAGLPERLHGRDSARVWSHALYGETAKGELDAQGLPLRLDWAAGYHGQAIVAYGHTPVQAARWRSRTVNLDTGCVFGGSLTALRYPELVTFSVPARAVYREAARAPLPLAPGEDVPPGP
ncbi:metallophosphoesterase [Deinococcus aquiradiocola]|uniref:Serine/threonine phosphatase n=1 Tax=Deinococcus aquiradiocola TaxID=393059 RepID=A0A917PLU8_9DEIO|nr:metallophosphoesterase [Deinococcus aquiradiocola]GGJ83502.1 serine/threonine phosphatase [Deinococcus aquiradiocola]